MKKRGAIHSSGEDRISFLPDPLLCQILSHLPTKIAVRTSTLSTKWKNLWLSIPLLDLDIDDFPDYTTFVSFVSRFLDFSKESRLHKLKLVFKREDCDLSSITSLIDTAVMRKIQHLDVDCRTSYISEMMPLSLYLCETLVSLSLYFVALHDFEFVSLPNLKTMHLQENLYLDDAILEKLISSCPVLEDLTLVRIVDESVKVLRVRSKTLKRLILVLYSSWYNDDSGDWEVLIDAPRVTYLSLEDAQSVSFVISNLSSSAKVDIDVSFNVKCIGDLNDSFDRSAVCKLLTGLSSVRNVTISETTLEIICHCLKHESMPQFRNLTRFEAEFNISDLEMLPGILESCPKVKGITYKEEMRLSSVPKCLQTSLEYVEMTSPNCGIGVEMMNVIKYIIHENSVVLNKFTLRLDCPDKEQESVIVMKELMRFQRCSTTCQINVVRF